jgi:hypothetical protein
MYIIYNMQPYKYVHFLLDRIFRSVLLSDEEL